MKPENFVIPTLPQRAPATRLIGGLLLALAAGGFGIAMQPFEPELAQFWPEVLFSGGVLTSMVVRYYRPDLYEDRPGREVIEWPLKRKNRA